VSPRVKRLLLLVVWIVPIAGVAWWASRQQAPTFPSRSGGILDLVGATALYAVATLLRAERWDRILRRAGIDAARADVYALIPVGYMGNNVLPARGGELLRTFLLGGRTRATKRTILGTILAERVLDAVALGVILLVLAYGLLRKLPTPSGTVVLAGAGGALVVVLAIAVAALRFRARLAGVLRALVPLAQPSRQLLSVQGAGLLAVSLAIWCVEAAVYVTVGHAVDIHLGLRDGLAVVAFTNAAALIPAAPGYVGTYDAAVIFAVNAVSTVAKRSVLSYLVLLRFVLFLPITLAGLLLLIARYGGLTRVRAARAEAAATAAA
jgi:glycosyltransferase 2 family protein